MLKEIRQTGRKPGEPRKRWFADADMDLFVWFDDDGGIVAYHLTYGKLKEEKALTWSHTHGFSHLGVDDGTRPGKYPASPLLVADGSFEPGKLIARLRQGAGDLDTSIAEFIAAGIVSNFDLPAKDN